MDAETLPEPRLHHYIFAHQALRSLIFARPLELFALLGLEHKGLAILQTIWKKVGEELQAHGGTPLPDQGLSAEIARSDGRPILLVQLPPPSGTTEAYFVAVIMTAPPRKRWLRSPNPPEIRYFTLERGADLSHMFPGFEAHNVLGEWTKDGSHLNHGPGPAAEKGAFLAAVAAMV